MPGRQDFDCRAIPAGALETRWAAPDGHMIRRIDWTPTDGDCCGSVLFLPGRGDAYEKYLESLDYWAGQGWRVTALDWRGQAGSGRLGRDAVTGHIEDFSRWTDDLAAFWAEWKAQTPAPHMLIGHSMGGHLVLRAVVEKQVDPDALVLVAPMLGFAAKILPPAWLRLIARIMVRIGDRRRPAWRWSERPGEVPADRNLLLTHDAERYADELWWRKHRPELVMGPGSWGWIERAYASMQCLAEPGVMEQVTVPVLILETSADRLVGRQAILNACDRLPQCEMVQFGDEARHEILRESDEVRDRALAAIDEFLSRAAPAPRSAA